jgi:hypothetical protein
MERLINSDTTVTQLWDRIAVRNPEDRDDASSETSVRTRPTRYKVPEGIYNTRYSGHKTWNIGKGGRIIFKWILRMRDIQPTRYTNTSSARGPQIMVSCYEHTNETSASLKQWEFQLSSCCVATRSLHGLRCSLFLRVVPHKTAIEVLKYRQTCSRRTRHWCFAFSLLYLGLHKCVSKAWLLMYWYQFSRRNVHFKMYGHKAYYIMALVVLPLTQRIIQISLRPSLDFEPAFNIDVLHKVELNS